MDTTTSGETFLEESLDWNNLGTELKAFREINNKNVQAVADITEDILKLKLVDTATDTLTCLEEKTKLLAVCKETRNLKKDQEEVALFRQSDNNVLENIEKLKDKILSIDEEIEKCTEERKKLRKEYKTSESALHRLIKMYETRFNMKVDIEEQSQNKLKTAISFSKPEKSIKLHVSLGTEMKINRIEVAELNQENVQYLEKCLEDETKVTPTLCILRDVLENQS